MKQSKTAEWIGTLDLTKVAVHEVIVKDLNYMFLDIDHLKYTEDEDIISMIYKIIKYIVSDSRINILYDSSTIRYNYSMYKKANLDEYSVHITFNFKLPLELQKTIAG